MPQGSGRRVPATTPTGADAPASLGATLHATRRRRRISMDRASAETRIRRDYLVAMEKDDFSFQAPVYVKGFVASYARFLRLDPAPLLAALEELHGPTPDEAAVLAEQNAVWAGRRRAFRPLLLPACALAILTALAFWTNGRDADRPPASSEVEAPGSSEQEDASARDDKQRGGGRADAASVADDGERAERVDVDIVAASARSWVEVTVDGRIAYSGVLELGETHSVTGEREVRVLLGYPAGVELTVDGVNLGSPGGTEVLEIALPDDIPSLS